MVVELICVGTELLLGNIVNTNAAWLAQKCAGLGLSCYYQTVVGDNMERLTETVKTAMSRADILILSGGLGPTSDDITKEAVAQVLELPLEMDEHSAERIRTFFAARKIEMTSNNLKQALIPQGAMVVDNDHGTAPALICRAEGKHIILLPGSPNELIPVFEERIESYLRSLCPGILYSRTVKLCGPGESSVAARIQDLLDAQTNPTIAPYAKTGEVHLRVTAFAETEAAAKELAAPVVAELENRFGKDIYTTEEQVTLEQAVVDLLAENKMTVSAIESCTGGLLSGRLINVAGVSDIYKLGFVTYSNKAKRKMAGVRKSTLKKYGAVSEETAREMAVGAAAAAKADVAVAITGIAGPGGGTETKPVGLVYIACTVKKKTTVIRCQFSGSRSKVRESSVAAALTLMRRCILEYAERNNGEQKHKGEEHE